MCFIIPFGQGDGGDKATVDEPRRTIFMSDPGHPEEGGKGGKFVDEKDGRSFWGEIWRYGEIWQFLGIFLDGTC